MANVVIELDQDQEKRLRALAALERKSAEELCSEAVETYLREREPKDRGADRYHPLQKMIGLASDGPTDSSVRHDVRAGDDR